MVSGHIDSYRTIGTENSWNWLYNQSPMHIKDGILFCRVKTEYGNICSFQYSYRFHYFVNFNNCIPGCLIGELFKLVNVECGEILNISYNFIASINGPLNIEYDIAFILFKYFTYWIVCSLGKGNYGALKCLKESV